MLVTKDNKIIVTQNPLGNFLYILVSFIFSALCFALFKFDEDLLFYERILMLIGFGFFGFGTIFFVFRTILNRNLIVVDENGIMDNTSAVSLGFIEWEDILDIKLNAFNAEELGGKFITIILADEDKYLDRVSPLKKPVILANMKLGYSPANITLNSSRVPIEEFYEKLIEYKNNLNK